jgi:hypothetical protein
VVTPAFTAESALMVLPQNTSSGVMIGAKPYRIFAR